MASGPRVRLGGGAARGRHRPSRGGADLLTSYVPAPGNPGPFYERLGFRPTGDLDENGEVILGLNLR